MNRSTTTSMVCLLRRPSFGTASISWIAAVHAHAHIALRAQLLEHLQMFALALADDRREQHVALVGIERQRRIDHLRHRLRRQRLAVVGAMRGAGARIQQAQIIVDLGDRADGRTRVVRGRFLLDRNRRRQTFDMVDVRLLHHRQELPRIRRQRFDIAALALGINRVERQRRLARTGQPGDHDQLVARQVEIDVLQIVRARTTQADRVHRLGSGKVGQASLRPGAPAMDTV